MDTILNNKDTLFSGELYITVFPYENNSRIEEKLIALFAIISHSIFQNTILSTYTSTEKQNKLIMNKSQKYSRIWSILHDTWPVIHLYLGSGQGFSKAYIIWRKMSKNEEILLIVQICGSHSSESYINTPILLHHIKKYSPYKRHAGICTPLLIWVLLYSS